MWSWDVTLCVLFFREMHVNSLCQSVVLLELVRPKGDPAHYSFSPHCTLFLPHSLKFHTEKGQGRASLSFPPSSSPDGRWDIELRLALVCPWGLGRRDQQLMVMQCTVISEGIQFSSKFVGFFPSKMKEFAHTWFTTAKNQHERDFKSFFVHSVALKVLICAPNKTFLCCGVTAPGNKMLCNQHSRPSYTGISGILTLKSHPHSTSKTMWSVAYHLQLLGHKSQQLLRYIFTQS